MRFIKKEVKSYSVRKVDKRQHRSYFANNQYNAYTVPMMAARIFNHRWCNIYYHRLRSPQCLIYGIIQGFPIQIYPPTINDSELTNTLWHMLFG